MAFLVFPPRNASALLHSPPKETFAGIPNELSAEEKPYELLLGIHRSTILPDSAVPPPILPPEDSVIPGVHVVQSDPSRDAPLGAIVRRRRSALDFDPRPYQWSAPIWSNSWILRRGIGARTGVGISTARRRSRRRSATRGPISSRSISTFTACATAKQASTGGTE